MSMGAGNSTHSTHFATVASERHDDRQFVSTTINYATHWSRNESSATCQAIATAIEKGMQLGLDELRYGR
jgi:hypothetical protein